MVHFQNFQLGRVFPLLGGAGVGNKLRHSTNKKSRMLVRDLPWDLKSRYIVRRTVQV